MRFLWVLSVLFFCMISIRSLSQNSNNKYSASDSQISTLVSKINSEDNFDLDSARNFIKSRKIKEKLLKELSFYVSQLKGDREKCQFYVALGYNFTDAGSYQDAQLLLIKALDMAEKNKFMDYQSCVYNIIAGIFGETAMYDKAIQNYYRALNIAYATKDSSFLSTIHLNLATTFYKSGLANQGLLDSAKFHDNIAITLAEKLHLTSDLNRAYQCLGLVETDEGDFKQAEIAFRKSIHVSEKLTDPSALFYGQYQLGRMFIEKGGAKEADSAIYYLKLAEDLSLKNNDFELWSEILYELARACTNKGEYKLSSYYAIRFSELNDSLMRLENIRTTAELSEKYESVKKEAQISELNLTQKEKQTQIDRQLYLIMGAVVVLIFICFIAFSLYRSNKIRKKINTELSEKNVLIEMQKKEVESQKELVEMKNKEIVDSIHYAKRIQQSLLPTEKYILRNLEKSKKTQ